MDINLYFSTWWQSTKIALVVILSGHFFCLYPSPTVPQDCIKLNHVWYRQFLKKKPKISIRLCEFHFHKKINKNRNSTHQIKNSKLWFSYCLVKPILKKNTHSGFILFCSNCLWKLKEWDLKYKLIYEIKKCQIFFFGGSGQRE